MTTFAIPTIVALRDKLYQEVFLPSVHETLGGEQLNYLVRETARRLPHAILEDTLFETLRQLVGQELTPQVCFELSWRLAGNLHRLRKGIPATPWTRQRTDEPIAMQIRKVFPQKLFEKIGFQVVFQVLAGSCCPMKLEKFWSKPLCLAVARRIGFSKHNGDMPYHDARQLVNLRIVGKVQALKSQLAPNFFEITCPPAFRDYNRELLKKRLHIIPCPRQFTHPCERCAVGYADCEAATHPATYVPRDCPHCHKLAPFDPASDSPECVPCTEQRHLGFRTAGRTQ